MMHFTLYNKECVCSVIISQCKDNCNNKILFFGNKIFWKTHFDLNQTITIQIGYTIVISMLRTKSVMFQSLMQTINLTTLSKLKLQWNSLSRYSAC